MTEIDKRSSLADWPDMSDSMAAILFSVASPSSPPKVMMGVRQEK